MIDPGTRQPFRKALSRSTWRKVRELVRRRDRHTCQVCGAPERRGPSGRTNLRVGHRTPPERYAGHHDDPGNLWLLCADCNSSQGNRTVEEWFAAATGRLVELGIVRPPGSVAPIGRSVLAPGDRWLAPSYPIHTCVRPGGLPTIRGNTNLGRWTGEGCPPGCDRGKGGMTFTGRN